jgi:hypothetical protein
MVVHEGPATYSMTYGSEEVFQTLKIRPNEGGHDLAGLLATFSESVIGCVLESANRSDMNDVSVCRKMLPVLPQRSWPACRYDSSSKLVDHVLGRLPD